MKTLYTILTFDGPIYEHCWLENMIFHSPCGAIIETGDVFEFWEEGEVGGL